MQVHTLKELIEKIPFVRYQEDRYGLAMPFYQQRTPQLTNALQVYINDRSLSSALTLNILRSYGELDLGFIDHVEIYLGLPSLDFGIENAAFVIKLYTKKGYRENTSFASASIGSAGSNDFYFYDAKGSQERNYLAFVSSTKLKRSTNYHKNKAFSKDDENSHLYYEYNYKNHRFEFEYLQNSKDAFLGESLGFDSLHPTLEGYLLYGGWYYEDSSIKAFANYTTIHTRYKDRSNPSPLGYLFTPHGIQPYRSFDANINDQIANLHLSYKYDSNNYHSKTGLQYRFKGFHFDNVKLDSHPVNADKSFDQEHILSIFHESDLLPQESSLVSLALKADRYIHNGNIADYTVYSSRLGYLYNDEKWTIKTYGMYKESIPSIYSLYKNAFIFHQRNKIDKTKGYAIGGRISYHHQHQKIALLLSRTWINRGLIYKRTPRGIQVSNTKSTPIYDAIDLSYINRLDGIDYLRADLWAMYCYLRGSTKRSYGALLGWGNEWGKWSIYNDFTYKRYYSSEGLNANVALRYRYSHKCSFTLKATNIFGTAITENYISFDPLSGQISQVKDVRLFDRRVWIGIEWLF